jgi:hypothetical protein
MAVSMPRKQSKPAASLGAVQAKIERLKIIERRLRQGSSLSHADSFWLANGLRGCLHGLTFEHALGLVRSRGRVGKQHRLAIKVDEYQRRGLTWEQIGTKLGRTPEGLQKLAAVYARHVEAHNTRRIAKLITDQLD